MKGKWLNVRIIRTRMYRKRGRMVITYAARNGRRFTQTYQIGVDPGNAPKHKRT